MKHAKLVCALLCLFLLFTGCAGSGDWTYELQGNYQIKRIHADRIILCEAVSEGVAHTVVDSFVSMVANTEDLIFVQQTDARPEPETSVQEIRYYIVFTADGTVNGPMTQAQFDELIAELLPDTTIQWYSTTDGSLSK